MNKHLYTKHGKNTRTQNHGHTHTHTHTEESRHTMPKNKMLVQSKVLAPSGDWDSSEENCCNSDLRDCFTVQALYLIIGFLDGRLV